MGMASFASFAHPVPTAALAYPSATAAASQALTQTLLGTRTSGRREPPLHRRVVVQLASANSPVPPSLVLKQLGSNPSGRDYASSINCQ
jgi:hypothetical protein